MKRLTLLIFLLGTVIGKAQTLTWTGAIDDDFAKAGNWSPAVTPTAGVDLLFDATAGIKGCNIGANNLAANSVSLMSGFTGTVDFATGSHLINSNLVINSGTVLGAQTELEFNSSGTFSLANSGVYIDGGGVTRLNHGVSQTYNFSGPIVISFLEIAAGSGAGQRDVNFGTNLTVTDIMFTTSSRIFSFQGLVHVLNSLNCASNSNVSPPTANTGTFVFDGSSSSIIASTTASRCPLPNFEINTTGNVTITGQLSVRGNVDWKSGTLQSGSSTVNMFGSPAVISGSAGNFQNLVLQLGSSITFSNSSSAKVNAAMTCNGTFSAGTSCSLSVGSNLTGPGLISAGSNFTLNVTGNYVAAGGLSAGTSNTISVGGVLSGTGAVVIGASSTLAIVGNYSATAGFTAGANSKVTVGGVFTSTGAVSAGTNATITSTGDFVSAGLVNIGDGSTIQSSTGTFSATSAVTTGTSCLISSSTSMVNNGGFTIGDATKVNVGFGISGTGGVSAGNTCTINVPSGNYLCAGNLSAGTDLVVISGGVYQSAGGLTAGANSTIQVPSTFSVNNGFNIGNTSKISCFALVDGAGSTAGSSSTITAGGAYTSAGGLTLGANSSVTTGTDVVLAGLLDMAASSTVAAAGNYTCDGGLNMAASTLLQVSGDFLRNNASLNTTSSSSITLNGSGTQNFTGANSMTLGVLTLVGGSARTVNLLTSGLAILNAVEVGSNVSFVTNNLLTLKSTNALTARVGALAGTANITGSVAKETVIQGGTTGWENLGSPGLSGQTFAAWDTWTGTGTNGIPMMCTGCTYTPGSVGSWFESILAWDETTPTYDSSLTRISVLTPGVGFWVYVGDGFSTTNDLMLINNGTLVQGNVNTQALTVTGSNTVTGCNLLANPYASPISFAAFLAANPTNTAGISGYYCWNADVGGSGGYAFYPVGGPGTNGATDVIAAGQGFYIVLTSATTLTFTEACKSSGNTQVLLRGSSSNPNAVKLQLQSPNMGVSDETVIRLNSQASADYDAGFDMKKIKSTPGYAGYPGPYSDYDMLYTKGASGIDYAVNTLSAIESNSIIELGVQVTSKGSYTISPVDIETFASCLFLHDKQLNVYHDLKTKGDYVFTVNNVSPANRFELQLCASKSDAAVAVENFTADQTKVVVKKDDNSIIVAMSFPTETDARVEAYNLLGQRIVAPITVYGKENTVRVPADADNDIVIVKVTTASAVYTKKVVLR